MKKGYKGGYNSKIIGMNMQETNKKLYCYVTSDENINFLGIFAFDKEPKCGDLVNLEYGSGYYVVFTSNEDISLDEFQVEEITKDEFIKFSNEWECQILPATNIYNKRQDFTN